jgi:aspartyl-tRNA(Asn)/glutamyl-tRNA(Gln) amidotransferase subunit A
MAETIEAAPDKMFDRVRERFRGGAMSAHPTSWRPSVASEVRRDWMAATAEYDAVLPAHAANARPTSRG